MVLLAMWVVYIGAVAVAGWYLSGPAKRAVRDWRWGFRVGRTPLRGVREAREGELVALHATAEPASGIRLLTSPATGTPCLAWQLRLREGWRLFNNGWMLREEADAVAFRARDDTGELWVSASGARIDLRTSLRDRAGFPLAAPPPSVDDAIARASHPMNVLRIGNLRASVDYEEALLQPGQRVYVLGRVENGRISAQEIVPLVADRPKRRLAEDLLFAAFLRSGLLVGALLFYGFFFVVLLRASAAS